jgi:hypothetical protein
LQWDPAPAPDYLVQPMRWARERGLRVMVVPHIAYWGTKFLWRGEIDWPAAENWNRFFAGYEKWIVHMARIAEANGASLFSVGLEYGPSQKYDRRWRAIIHAVRSEYRGPITYGANWDEVENVPFWDAVDYIGVLAYFPITKKPAPDRGEIAAGWAPWMEKLRVLSERHRKPVVFTEIGYNDTIKALSAPWDFHEKPSAAGAALQSLAMEQALALPDRYPFLVGMFWWKWFPDVPWDEPATFDLRAARTRAILRRYWGSK